MDKMLYSIIALLLAGVLGIGIYALISHPSDAASLAPAAASAVTGAVQEVGGAFATQSQATDSGGNVPQPSANGTEVTGTSKTAGTFTMAEVKKHNSASSCYAVVQGAVYDLTNWIGRHPGGEEAILSLCGTDGTFAFENQHGGERRPESELASHKIGVLAK
jgi:predicted heme/steroid binding protein